MAKEQDRQIDTYLEDSSSWARDRLAIRVKSERRAWIVASVASAIAMLEAIALLALTPLKTVEPYTLLVDRQTGYVEALKPLDPRTISDDAALTESFLTQYVIAREGFDYDSVRADYRKVGLWSIGEARRAYVAQMQASNPDGPLSRYRRSTTVEVTVKSVSSLSPRVAMVRFLTERRDAGGAAADPRHWVAVIRYGYSSAPLSVEDRLLNPLGFQVSRYRRSYEALPPPSTIVQTGGGTRPRDAAPPRLVTTRPLLPQEQVAPEAQR